jgi:hypothetical protein
VNHARDGTHSLLRDTSQLFLLAQADKSTALKHRFHRYHRAGRHRALTGTEKWQRPGGWFLRFNSALIKVDSRSRSSCSDCASPIGGVWSVHSTICVHPRASGVPIACFVRTAHRLVVWHGAGVTVPNRAAECGANVSQKLEPQMHADQIVQIGNLSLGSVPGVAPLTHTKFERSKTIPYPIPVPRSNNRDRSQLINDGFPQATRLE